MNLIEKADVFAEAAHAAVGQVRKYTNEDYIVHPRGVLKILMQASGVNEDMQAATLLHDVLEDTKTKKRHILAAFNPNILRLVMGLSDVTTTADGDRPTRKAIERAHLAGQLDDVLTIKIADCIHNAKSIIANEPGFAKIYIAEMDEMMPILERGDAVLYAQLKDIIKKYHEKVRLEAQNPPKARK